MKNGAYFFILWFVLVTVSCSSDDDFGPQNTSNSTNGSPSQKDEPKLFLLNEGNFMHGNASLDVYDLVEDKLYNALFEQTNGSRLGDVAQSGLMIGDTLAVVVNNSGKIVLIDKNNYTLIAELTSLNSPRYLAPMPNGNFLLTELYADKMQEIDFENIKVVNEFNVDGWTEEVHVTQDNLAFVRNVEHRSIDVYDLSVSGLRYRGGEGKVRGVAFGREAAFFVTADFIAKWAYTSSDYEILVTFKDSLSARRPALTNENDAIYFLADGVYRAVLTEKKVERIMEGKGRNFYGLAVDPQYGDVYVTDAKDYISRGTIYRTDKLGIVKAEHKTGIIPQAMIF